MNIDKKQPYSIESYNPEWVTEFKRIKKILGNIFGTKALAIEHIGSTSVPGMSAKPVVDVALVVEKIESFDKEKEEMTKLGYESKDNYIAPETIIFFKTDDTGVKTENIHVCSKNSDRAIHLLASRDYLRTHPERAQQYSDLKDELYKKFPDDYVAYREAKRDFVNETEALTKEWLGER
jgi:GrpB-like predicted nucleotidyltransferase (UPF0157 family)